MTVGEWMDSGERYTAKVKKASRFWFRQAVKNHI